MFHLGTNQEMQLREHVLLAPYTTIGVGGEARFFAETEDKNQLKDIIRWAKRQELPFFLLGGGSNLVFPDRGFPGLVIRYLCSDKSVWIERTAVDLRVAAGAVWDDLVAFCTTAGWAGLECLSGIPGLVGAAPIQNIGAYGQEVSETITAVEILDSLSLQERTLLNSECDFGYRDSIFKHKQGKSWIVTAVHFRLAPEGKPTVLYPELQNLLPANASIAEVREQVLALRRTKSMVSDPADPNSRSCGSFFLNPILPESTYSDLRTRWGSEIPQFPAKSGFVKVPAAWLIERTGISKGYGKGRAGISEKHALAIINRGGASAVEIESLAEEIQSRVEEVFGIRLHPEPMLFSNVRESEAPRPSQLTELNDTESQNRAE